MIISRQSPPSLRATAPGTRTNQLATVQDVVDIQFSPLDRQMEGWIALAIKKPQSAVLALENAGRNLDLTRGQRRAMRSLQRRAAEIGSLERQSAVLRGGLVALRHMSRPEVTLTALGKAAYDLVLGSQDEADSTRKVYIESGLDTLYSRAYADGSVDLKVAMPELTSSEDPVFMANLLRLDPDFRRLPPSIGERLTQEASSFTLPANDRALIEGTLERAGKSMTPALTALTASRGQVLKHLEAHYGLAVENLDHESAQLYRTLHQAIGRVDGETLLDVTHRCEGSQALRFTPLSEQERRWARNIRIGHAAMVALGLAVTAGATLAGCLWDPTFGEAFGIAGGLVAMLLVGVGVQGPEQTLRHHIQDRYWVSSKIQHYETVIIEACSKPAQGVGKGVSIPREEVLTVARGDLALQSDSLGVRRQQELIAQLESLSGQTAAEMFEQAFLAWFDPRRESPPSALMEAVKNCARRA